MTETDVEAMLAACLPGGSHCDPQQVADSIRAWMANRGDPWRDAVIAELDSLHITTAELEADPRAALRAVIAWNQRIALDPAVSSDAQALVDRGRAEMTPADPLDMRLPCDIRIGHGTHGKGTPLRTLVTRMRLLYDMAQEAAAAKTLPVKEAHGMVWLNGALVVCEQHDHEPCPHQPERRCTDCPARPRAQGAEGDSNG